MNFRQDLIFVHPDDHDKAWTMFQDLFPVWSEGYRKRFSEQHNFQINFVKDSSIKRGILKGVSTVMGQEVFIRIV